MSEKVIIFMTSNEPNPTQQREGARYFFHYNKVRFKIKWGKSLLKNLSLSQAAFHFH